MSLQPGTRLSNYAVLSDLGSGGMREVYEAHDLELGRDVAIKVIQEYNSSGRCKFASSMTAKKTAKAG